MNAPMPACQIDLRGTSLHGGNDASVRLARVDGPLVWAQRGEVVAQRELRVAATDRGVRIEAPGGRVAIDSVEHLLAAFGGLGVHRGVRIETDDDELPLLDGGARAFVAALRELGAPRARPPLAVARAAIVRAGASTYRFAPSDGVRVAVDVAFRPPVGHERAAWDGDADDFAARIAPARTFGWLDEQAALVARGRARGASFDAVLVFVDGGAHSACRPAEPTEVARHKLLDVVGDAALYGGPPLGSLEATAPGHAATHAAFREAIASGILVSSGEGCAT